jgi:hypothetical protein
MVTAAISTARFGDANVAVLFDELLVEVCGWNDGEKMRGKVALEAC